MADLDDKIHESLLKNSGSTHLTNERALMMATSELLKKLGTPTDLINKMVLRHMKLGDTWLDYRNNIYKAIEFAKLGASKPVLEKLATILAKHGYQKDLKDVREQLLKSAITKNDAFLLLKNYNEGASQCDETEESLLSLGRDILSTEEYKKFRNLLEKRRERWKSQID